MRCWRPWSRDYRQTAIAAPNRLTRSAPGRAEHRSEADDAPPARDFPARRQASRRRLATPWRAAPPWRCSALSFPSQSSGRSCPRCPTSGQAGDAKARALAVATAGVRVVLPKEVYLRTRRVVQHRRQADTARRSACAPASRRYRVGGHAHRPLTATMHPRSCPRIATALRLSLLPLCGHGPGDEKSLHAEDCDDREPRHSVARRAVPTLYHP